MRFAVLAACFLAFLAGRAHAGSILTQGQLNTELGTNCAAQGKTAPCIGPAQMSDLIATAVPAVVTGITAAGTTQGTATALTGQVNDVATVAAGTGVVLPTAVAGQTNTVCDDGANSLLVYPASGAAIGANAANSPVDDDVAQCISLVALSSTAWRLISGNPGSTLAAGYYASPNGSDSNPGTLAMPFQTLGACQTAMQSGLKICYVRAGSYALPSGGLVLTTTDNGETFQYYPPDGVGSAVLTTGSVAASTFAITDSCVGCTLDGLTLNVSGNVAAWIAIGLNAANGTQFLNNVVNGENAAAPYYLIDVYGAMSNAIIAGNTLENWGTSSGGDAIIMNAALTNSVIKNNTFQCIAQYGIISGASGSNGNLIYSNTFVGGGHVGGAPPGCGSAVFRRRRRGLGAGHQPGQPILQQHDVGGGPGTLWSLTLHRGSTTSRITLFRWPVTP